MKVSYMEEFDTVIVGGGMAGLSAAVFLGRAGVRSCLLDAGESSLRRVERVNNYIGFPDGVGGTKLLELGREQALRFGAGVNEDSVTSITVETPGFVVRTGTQSFGCRFVILASNKRTDLATGLGLTLGGHGGRFVSVDEDGRTAVPGCFAAGRITGKPSQAVIAAGDGARVAIAIIEQIRSGYYVDHDT
jgi:thioredoxin reductase (NADPH)